MWITKDIYLNSIALDYKTCYNYKHIKLMNIINLLTEKKYVVGIEISDYCICVAYFKKTNGKKDDKLTIITKTLEEGVILNGQLKNAESLIKNLTEIWSDEKLEKSYAVVSIPEDQTYSRILSFPDNISESQLHEAILLATSFLLDLKTFVPDPVNPNCCISL